jgi:hypothetical protein
MASTVNMFMRKNKLNPEMSLDELAQYHVSDLLALLTDKVNRMQARRRLQYGYDFSKEQVTALIPSQKVGRRKGISASIPAGRSEEAEDKYLVSLGIIKPPIRPPREEKTIGNSAQHIVRDNLGEAEVRATAKGLAKTAANDEVGSSRLSRLRRDLHHLTASESIISATFFQDITSSANKIQKEN